MSSPTPAPTPTPTMAGQAPPPATSPPSPWAVPPSPLSSSASERVLGAVFSGWYTERVWRDRIGAGPAGPVGGAYLDRVTVDEAETEVLRSLRSLWRRRRKISVQLAGDTWEKIGDSFHLFSDWSCTAEPPPFGHYWFQVEAWPDETRREWKLKILRPVVQSDSHTTSQCPHCGKLPSDSADPSSSPTDTDDPLNLSQIAASLQRQFAQHFHPVDWARELRPHLTVAKFMDVARFLVVLSMAVVSGAASLLPQVLHHVNRFVHEMALLLKAATPVLLACVGVVNRAIGGFYLLVSMVWRDVRKPARPAPSMAALEDRGGGGGRARGQSRFPYKRENVQRPYFQQQNFQ